MAGFQVTINGRIWVTAEGSYESLEKEIKHWQEYYDDDKSTAVKVMEKIAEYITPAEPYGVDPSGYQQQRSDEDKARYLDKLQTLAAYVSEVERMRKQFALADLVEKRSILAVPGVVQILPIHLRLEPRPDHKPLLARTPRQFNWN